MPVSVGQQVDEHLRKPPGVTFHGQQLGQVSLQDLPLLLHQRVYHRYGICNGGAQVEWLAIETQRASLELIQGEEIVNKHAEALDAAPSVGE